uniref:Cytosolic-abundant heat soluble protein 89226 n=1 Tax=Hypsibius exemplaris TaxID=2072580 RepID=CAHS5_HYPEX
MATKESKYERVEKVNVDADGATLVKNIGEDRGKEDPGMNYQDKRPANLVPGAPAGVIPNRIESLPTDRAGQRLREHLSESERLRGSRSSTSSKSSSFVEPSLKYRGEIGPIGKNGEFVASSNRQNSSSNVSSSDNSERASPASRNSNPGMNNGMTTQRTTVITESSVQGLGAQRTVPIQPHQQREDHEVITHESHARAPETTVVTIPTTRFESAQLESRRDGRTYTEDKELTIPAPVVAPQIHAHQQVNMSGGTSATIHATTDLHLASEAQINDMGPEEYERYRAKVEALARIHEDETSRKAAAYRNAVEADAELIRQTLERQHMRDIEFRKDLVESSVDRQQQEIRLEAEYAMRALEQERVNARAALDQAMASTNIDVNIDSAIGTTHSQGRVTTTSESRTSQARGPATAAVI